MFFRNFRSINHPFLKPSSFSAPVSSTSEINESGSFQVAMAHLVPSIIFSAFAVKNEGIL